MAYLPSFADLSSKTLGRFRVSQGYNSPIIEAGQNWKSKSWCHLSGLAAHERVINWAELFVIWSQDCGGAASCVCTSSRRSTTTHTLRYDRRVTSARCIRLE